MTHAELRNRLPAYADGTLADGEVEAVRAHLATGCTECLGDVFTRPVGLPRPQPVVIRRWSPALVVAMAAGAIGIGVGVGALLALTRTSSPTRDDPSLHARVERLESQARPDEKATSLESLAPRAPMPSPTTTLPPPTTPSSVTPPSSTLPPPAPSSTLPSSTAPSSAPSGSDPAAVDADAVPAWLEELLSSEGARVMALGAADFAPGATGYAVWSPARGVVIVSASGLPSGGRQAVYRVRVQLSDGSTVWVGDLAAADHGTLLVTVAMPETDGRRVTGVDLYRDPPGTPALTAVLRHERAGDASMMSK